MRKGFVLAAVALVVILAAGSVDAQQQVFWLAPGERVDYAGAVDMWTGSVAQYTQEGNRSYIHGPARDLRRHWAANNGNPDPYYGTGTSPASAPYGLGDRWGSNNGYAYDTSGYNRGYRRPGNSHYGNRNRGYRRSHSNHRNGRNRDLAVIGAVALGTVISEVRADNRDDRADRRHQEEMAELRAQREREREYEPESPRNAEARGYYGNVQNRSSRTEYKLINGLGMDVCVNDTLLNADNGNRTTVSDPYHMKFSAPPGKTICPVEAEFISEDTILATCKKGG